MKSGSRTVAGSRCTGLDDQPVDARQLPHLLRDSDACRALLILQPVMQIAGDLDADSGRHSALAKASSSATIRYGLRHAGNHVTAVALAVKSATVIEVRR